MELSESNLLPLINSVKEKSRLLGGVQTNSIIVKLLSFYADEFGLSRTKSDPIDVAEYFDDYQGTADIAFDLQSACKFNIDNMRELILLDPKAVEILEKIAEEDHLDAPVHSDYEDEEIIKSTPAEIWNWLIIDGGVDQLDLIRKEYYELEEEFEISELDKEIEKADDTVEDPFDMEFEDNESNQDVSSEDAVKKTENVKVAIEEPEVMPEKNCNVHVSRSSTTINGNKDSLIDANIQCTDDQDSIMAALDELICTLGLADEFGIECDHSEIVGPREEVPETVAEVNDVEGEDELKDLTDEEEVKVEVPEEIADDVKPGDTVVVKLDDEPTKEDNEEDDDEEDLELYDDEEKDDNKKDLEEELSPDKAYDKLADFFNE